MWSGWADWQGSLLLADDKDNTQYPNTLHSHNGHHHHPYRVTTEQSLSEINYDRQDCIIQCAVIYFNCVWSVQSDQCDCICLMTRFCPYVSVGPCPALTVTILIPAHWDWDHPPPTVIPSIRWEYCMITVFILYYQVLQSSNRYLVAICLLKLHIRFEKRS